MRRVLRHSVFRVGLARGTGPGRVRRRERGLRLRGWIGASAGRTPGAPLARVLSGEVGATTAEFAIVTMAAVGFAGLLVVILRSDGVRATLEGLVARALGSAG